MRKTTTRTYLNSAAGVAVACAFAFTAVATDRESKPSKAASPVTGADATEALNAAVEQYELRRPRIDFQELPDGTIIANGNVFPNIQAYFASDFFRENGLRCGTPTEFPLIDGGPVFEGGVAGGSASDCSLNCTNPASVYDPSVVRYRIPVVVHVIQNTSGQGFISAAQVESQIRVLNEDFQAIAGTNGANGYNTEIEFVLATVDPNGNPTTGITYSTNNTWFNDGGSYWNSLAWDPHNYLNIYTNNAGGNLGYVPFLPQQGGVGTLADRVVIYWASFGDDSPGFPYHQGRTATHEVGHYLGLYHTFQNGCGSTANGPCGGTNCHTTGDRCCDTNAHSSQQFGCPFNSTCGDGEDPRRNYMNYTDDLCMWEFTPEQARRMRCTLEHYRPQLYEIVQVTPENDTCADAALAFEGSFEFSTVNASTDGPNEAGMCNINGYTNVGNDVWFKYLAGCTGQATVSLCGANFNSKVAIYGSCPAGAGEVIACADDGCGDDPTVTFPVVAGTVYRIRIGGFNGATGTGNLVISCTPGAACSGDVNNSGGVDVSDLLAVITAWGPCGGCPADVAPPGGDGQVNVADLLEVINAWGPCP